MKIISLFGYPGCGKGTQAANLVEEYGLLHISTGDILRYIRAQGGELADQIGFYQDRGELVPDHIVVKCLEDFMETHPTKTGYVIEGFPRNLRQNYYYSKLLAEKFPDVAPLYIYLLVREKELVQRLSRRAEIEGRSDDTPETINNRFLTFKEETLPVIERYHNADKLHIVLGTGKKIPEVWSQVKEIVEKNCNPVSV